VMTTNTLSRGERTGRRELITQYDGPSTPTPRCHTAGRQSSTYGMTILTSGEGL
jgi:hypothetical protein